MSVLQFFILLLSAAFCCAAIKPDDAIKCNRPKVDNGRVNNFGKDVFNNDDVIQITCNEGYRPNRNGESTCTKDDWSPKPSCTEITCDFPIIEKGSVDAKKPMYRYEEEIIVNCNDGYVLHPEPNTPRKCKINGWVPAPTCVSKKCDQPYIKNGYLYHSYWFPKYLGTTIEYRCNQNYLTPQKAYWGRLECTSVGWHPEPECLRQCHILKAFIENADIVNPQSVYQEGEVVQFTCRPNFHTPDRQRRGTRTCLPDGEFTTGKCSAPCTAPQLLNGKFTNMKNQLVNGEYLQYECDKGYMTEKHNLMATVQCLNGKWSETPRCIAITCDHGSSSHSDKDVITYTCPSGKRPKSDLVQCFNYGWGPPIICEEQKPGQPDAINPPKDKDEKEEKIQKCPLAHNPKNAEVIDLKKAYYSNNNVTMKCNKGYRMYGSATIRCVDGKWEQPPECYEIGDRCGSPPTIPFGDTIDTRRFSYEPGEFVEYQCPHYHDLKGEKIVTCLDGVWGEAPVCLEPCTAKENSMDENNIQLKFGETKKRFLKYGEEIEFSCIFGYEALPNTQMKITCEHGKLEYPTCLRKGFCILQQSAMIANNIHYNISTVVERGQTITFRCNENMIPENGLEGTCKLGIMQYPKCTAAKSSV